MSENLSKRCKAASDMGCSILTSEICVEQEEDRGGTGKPSDLRIRDGSAEEGDGIGESGLGQAHCSPWTFHNDHCTFSKGFGPVGVVEDLCFGEVFGEAPFARLRR